MAAEKGFCLWFTGLSGSGKTTITNVLVKELRKRGSKLEVLDGDIVRQNLSKGLGFSKEDRDTNIRRVAFVADLLSRNGVPVITAAISPYREIRDEARAKMDGRFIEAYVKASVEECERARRQGPLREGPLRRDQGVHRRLRPLRGSREPRAGDRHREPDSRGVGAADPQLPRGAGAHTERRLVASGGRVDPHVLHAHGLGGTCGSPRP